MSIAHAFQQHLKSIFTLSLLILLTACGGGGSKKDITPDAFSFTSVTDAAISTEVTSTAITVAGINKATAISITGGTYSINNGAFTAAAGTVTSGQTVKVKVTSSAATSTAVVATVTIGGVNGTFTVTTLADTTPPTAQIIFPPAVSMSDGTALKVRGTAHDDASSISNVTVNGIAATSTDNFATWTADVPLSLGANTLTVVTTDSANNSNSDAAHVSTQRVASVANTSVHFPDANVPFQYVNFFAIDNSRALVTDTGRNAIVAVDLNTGIRTILSDATTPNTNTPFVSPQGIAIDKVNNRALVIDYNLKAVIAVDLTTGARTVVSDATTPDSTNPLTRPFGIAVDVDATKNRNRVLLTDSQANTLFAMDLSTYARTILSDATTPNTNVPFSSSSFGLIGFAVDQTNNRALLVEQNLKAIFSVDLTTGARTIVSDSVTPNANNPFGVPLCIALDSARNRILVTDSDNNSIVSVDLTSGARTILSSPTVPNSNTALIGPQDISIDSVKNVAFVSNIYPAAAISVVDIITGERVVLSQ